MPEIRRGDWCVWTGTDIGPDREWIATVEVRGRERDIGQYDTPGQAVDAIYKWTKDRGLAFSPVINGWWNSMHHEQPSGTPVEEPVAVEQRTVHISVDAKKARRWLTALERFLDSDEIDVLPFPFDPDSAVIVHALKALLTDLQHEVKNAATAAGIELRSSTSSPAESGIIQGVTTSIYIDVVTGTWGDTRDLYEVRATEEQIPEINEESDSGIIQFAHENGSRMIGDATE